MRAFYSTPFPHTEAFDPPDWDEDEEIPPEWITGSLIVVEYGCCAFYRIVLTGKAAGQVWYDDLPNNYGIHPGPDFHEWYMSWLETNYDRFVKGIGPAKEFLPLDPRDFLVPKRP